MGTLHRAATIALLSTLVGCAQSGREAPFKVAVGGQAATCSVSVNGRVVTNEELLVLAQEAAKSKRQASIDLDAKDTPYRCIGGTIYTMQMAGFEYLDFAGRSPFADAASNIR